VYLDGTAVLVNREVSINELITPEQVQAIEIFRGPPKPPRSGATASRRAG
jgi:hypothetical protein